MADNLHFGEVVNPGKYGARLTRELYAIPNKKRYNPVRRELVSDAIWDREASAFEDEEHRVYTDEWCERQRINALENYDLNMQFFQTLSSETLESMLKRMLTKRKTMREVHTLRDLEGVEGVYVLVLDAYRQAYVGKAQNMRERIRRHWTGTKPFDRLLFGHKHESVIGLDAFRILDTTRIFAYKTSRPYPAEAAVVKSFSPDYLLNRIGGGEMSPLRVDFLANEMKRRQLIAPESAAVVSST